MTSNPSVRIDLLETARSDLQFERETNSLLSAANEQLNTENESLRAGCRRLERSCRVVLQRETALLAELKLRTEERDRCNRLLYLLDTLDTRTGPLPPELQALQLSTRGTLHRVMRLYTNHDHRVLAQPSPRWLDSSTIILNAPVTAPQASRLPEQANCAINECQVCHLPRITVSKQPDGRHVCSSCLTTEFVPRRPSAPPPQTLPGLPRRPQEKAPLVIDEVAELCEICYEAPKTTALVPCGHVFCTNCAETCLHCFKCRVHVSCRLRLYM